MQKAINEKILYELYLKGAFLFSQSEQDRRIKQIVLRSHNRKQVNEKLKRLSGEQEFSKLKNIQVDEK